MRMMTARWRALAAVVVMAAAGAGPAHAEWDREDLVTPFHQDVFVLVSGQLRNPDGTTPPEAALFNVAGTDLGLTWGQFRLARATSRARCRHDGRTEVRLRLGGLVPNGVYSAFYATFSPDSRNPLCPNAERLLPLLSRDPQQEPDAASFVADAAGEADFQARVEGCLLEAAQLTIALVYHFDGLTYGDLPNRGEFVTQGPECRPSWGADAMRQALIVQKQIQ